MKYLSLRTKRIIILLVPATFVALMLLFSLISYFIDNPGVETVLALISIVLYSATPLSCWFLFLSYWRCPHCDKLLMHWLAIIFIGWFWLLLHTSEDCSHCGKKLDYNAVKKKEKKLPEWAQQLENKKTLDDNEYFRH